MAFDREAYKKRSKEGRPVAKVKDGHFKEKRSLKIASDALDEHDIKRITVESISDEIDKSYIKGFVRGKLIDSAIDEFISWELGQLLISTGIPSHGKSEFMDFLFVKLNVLYGWKVMYYSPENYPTPNHYHKIAKKLVGYKIGIESPEYQPTKDYINDNFSWIYYERNTIEVLLQTAKKYIDEADVRVLVIDPYNMVDSSMLSNETETLYINRFLDLLSKFAKRNGVLVVLVAHPTKIGKESGSRRHLIPTMYSISGSAHFYNKADYGMVIHRKEDEDGRFEDITEAHIQKVRFSHLGETGVAEYLYNKKNGRYSTMKDDVPQHDDTNWIEEVEL